MANSPQAKKRVRQNERRAATNRARISRIRTFVKKVEEAIEAGDQEAASAAFRAAEPELMRGAGKGVLHKRTAARKVSRLAGRIRSMAN
jgi:small subunit ribosomal protein S20